MIGVRKVLRFSNISAMNAPIRIGGDENKRKRQRDFERSGKRHGEPAPLPCCGVRASKFKGSTDSGASR
jgi:hypothetical protein